MVAWFRHALLLRQSKQLMIKPVSTIYSQCLITLNLHPSPIYVPIIIVVIFSECNPGTIKDLTDLLAEDWSQLGSIWDMGAANKRFFRAEMEQTWGQKHLAVLDKEEAHKWLLGVHIDISFCKGGLVVTS